MKENLSKIKRGVGLGKFKNDMILLKKEKKVSSRACTIMFNQRSRLRRKFLNYLLSTFEIEGEI